MDELDELEDIFLDDDGNFVEASDGDCITVTGVDVVIQDIKHELMTLLGSLWIDPDYGSLILTYVHTENTPMSQKELMQEVQIVLEKHPNVDNSTIEVNKSSWDMQTIELSLDFDVQDVETMEIIPTALLISIDQNGIHVLEVSN